MSQVSLQLAILLSAGIIGKDHIQPSLYAFLLIKCIPQLSMIVHT